MCKDETIYFFMELLLKNHCFFPIFLVGAIAITITALSSYTISKELITCASRNVPHFSLSLI